MPDTLTQWFLADAFVPVEIPQFKCRSKSGFNGGSFALYATEQRNMVAINSSTILRINSTTPRSVEFRA
ncbi:unnamed protein product [Lasius platythorax]|uniref:Uncharacterized protein n=1 Tax=Lasius platythorax TaxID=488582 RepID=A0AAV2NQ48_9HYME